MLKSRKVRECTVMKIKMWFESDQSVVITFDGDHLYASTRLKKTYFHDYNYGEVKGGVLYVEIGIVVYFP